MIREDKAVAHEANISMYLKVDCHCNDNAMTMHWEKGREIREIVDNYRRRLLSTKVSNDESSKLSLFIHKRRRAS